MLSFLFRKEAWNKTGFAPPSSKAVLYFKDTLSDSITLILGAALHPNRGYTSQRLRSEPDIPQITPDRTAYLGKDVGIGVILQEHSGCPRVIVAGSYVQRGKAHLAFCPIVNQVGHNIFVALLKRHC